MTSRLPALLLVAVFCLLSACGKDVPEPLGPQPPTHVYEYGTTVNFGLGGDGDRFRQRGWSQPEQGYTWTDGAAASLALRVPPADGPLALDVTLQGLTKPPELPAQTVLIYVNGTQVAEWQVASRAIYHADLPVKVLPPGGGLVNVDLVLPRAISPAELNGSADLRRLALQCFDLKLSPGGATKAAGSGPGRAYAPGTVIRFGEGQEGQPYQVSGWHPAEKEFTWTEGAGGKLAFDLPATHAPLILRTRLAGMVKEPDLPNQPAEVYANGQKVAVWSVADTALFEVTLSAELVGAGGPLMVELRTPRATAPELLGLGKDARVLGVRCYDMQLTPPTK